MRTIAPLTLALVLASTLAWAQDAKPATNALPVNPFEHSKLHDWSVYEVTLRSLKGEKKEKTLVVRERVEVVEDADVKLGFQALLKKNDLFGDAWRSAPRQAPTLEALFPAEGSGALAGFPKDGKVTRFESSDAKRKLGDKELATKLVRFTVEGGSTKTTASLWLSTEVKAKGILAYEAETTEKSFAWTLVAMGNEKTTEWGKIPADLAATDAMQEIEVK
jgi:hypothetical protein